MCRHCIIHFHMAQLRQFSRFGTPNSKRFINGHNILKFPTFLTLSLSLSLSLSHTHLLCAFTLKYHRLFIKSLLHADSTLSVCNIWSSQRPAIPEKRFQIWIESTQ
ncbi:hypothetical protein L1987_29545 [Smallanthus sonchifolius]|uniref:Uncharacterized protein n=1 Tax=Smallanthus sonchifolius TaxID=185202 RepID=A0ACB9I233_9ASTR|nr:hypothetical protein L1987_29545 [Smallanthus sonchifolius]